mgnify:FL=1
MRVLYITNIPSPYKVDYYNELGKTCELTVLFELADSSERSEEWKKYRFETFEGIILKGKRMSVDTAVCPEIVKYLKKGRYDVVVLSVLASPTALLAAHTLRRRKIPYYYEGDGGFAGQPSGIKAAMKHYVISAAEKCLSSSEEFDRYCITYGAKPGNILRYPFTSVKKADCLTEKLTEEEKRHWKQELGITEECAVISVGQFIPRKGMDLLLHCCKDLPENVGVYIVGGTPPEEYLSICEKYDLKQVHFLDFMPKDQLMKLFLAMDVFALFTREDIWGLVINEAMAAGLPVISTDRCIAALELIRNGEEGMIVENENLQQMREALLTLVRSPELREKMSDHAIRRIQGYTIENMAAEHSRIFAQKGKQESKKNEENP